MKKLPHHASVRGAGRVKLKITADIRGRCEPLHPIETSMTHRVIMRGGKINSADKARGREENVQPAQKQIAHAGITPD